MDSGIENMEVDENDRREKRSLSDKVGKRWRLTSVLSAVIQVNTSCLVSVAPVRAGHPNQQVLVRWWVLFQGTMGSLACPY